MMDPIKWKGTAKPVGPSQATTKQPIEQALSSPAPLPHDNVELQSQVQESPASTANQKSSERQTRKEDSAKSAAGSTPVTTSSFQDRPQAILEDPLAVTVSGGERAKTLAQLSAEVSATPAPSSTRRQAIPSTLSAGHKTSLLRQLAHGFFTFLASNRSQPFKAELAQVNKLEKSVANLRTPAQFQAKTAEFRARITGGESLESLRTEAYAVARQAAQVALGMRPYDCQIQGALAMDDGHIAQMRTGEGKTLTALMPLYLNALMGKGAHLVTVNDTLASRDAQEMKPAFEILGLSVGTVLESMTADQKRAGYAADVTYTTDRALGFDYLRDQTAKNPALKVQREPFFALIDEVDEVLIDEARSPLIVSGPGVGHQAQYQEFHDVVSTLESGKDYYLDRKRHSVWLSETGMNRVENMLCERALKEELANKPTPERKAEIIGELENRAKLHQALTQEQSDFQGVQDLNKKRPGTIARWRGAEWDEGAVEKAQEKLDQSTSLRESLQSELPPFNLYSDEESHRVRYLYAALKAKALFQKGKDYTVTDGKVEIVDENKGRTSEGRRYNDGVHQAIEAKEGVSIGDDQRTIASITYPNLFKRYARLAGMSGTAEPSEAEFVKLYGLDVVPIPTNKPVIREDKQDLIFRTLAEKFEAVASDAAADFFDGKPVLIGTLSVEHNEYLAKLLQEKGIPRESMQVLNAETVRGDKEGENEMIGQAGRSGVITVATNLAGRGANIKPDLVNFKKLAETTVKAVSEGKPVSVLVNKKKEADWLNSWLGNGATVAPWDSSAAPGPGEVQIRYRQDSKQPASAPPWKEGTLQLDGDDFPTGGLTLYGTERSTSRRIDDQLIGRAGRQGAPGSSRFYLSLEDNLLRIFAGSKLDGIAEHFLKPGHGVSGGLLDTIVEQAQSSVQSEHFAARESTNKQDDVLNVQRDTFFTMRNELLEGGKPLRDRFETMVGNAVCEEVFRDLPEKKSISYEKARTAVRAASESLQIPLSLPFLERSDGPQTIKPDDLELELRDLVSRQTQKLLRAMKQVTGRAEEAVRPLLLDSVDDVWADHLEQMDILRQGVQWQSLAQHDPEVEYKLQAFDLFGETVAEMDRRVTTGIFKDLSAFAEVVKANTPAATST